MECHFVSMFYPRTNQQMSPTLFSKFLFCSFRAFFILIQMVSNAYCASNNFTTILNRNTYIEDGSKVVSFGLPHALPIYPAGGDFRNGIIDLGGLQVYEAFYFKKIWDTDSVGPEGNGASFYEPTFIPPGFNLLGHYSQLNNMTMFSSVLTAKDTTGDPSNGALKSPIDYILIWTSKGQIISEYLEDGYIWLPIPPSGYKAIGHIVTTSLEKPSLDKVKCVRNDFTDSIEVDERFWGFKYPMSIMYVDLYTTKPINKALSVPAGTFLARANGSSSVQLVCLKMVKSDPYSAMPNPAQIRTMIKSYAPWVYYHPDEKYLPSSVLWFFRNGIELHQTGQDPTPVINNGDNLPTNGSRDDAFLDLPPDHTNKQRVKKGSLADAVAYIHVKPALGGTFTDLAIWLYHPFNGGAIFQLGPFVIDLGVIGEHVSDWEHMTLRVDNYRGILKAIYLSQHSKGKWLTPLEFELMNGTTRPVIYASLHGHALYNTASSFLRSTSKLDSSTIKMLYDEFEIYQRKSPIVNGDKSFGLGVRDDTAIGDNLMDIASSYNVVCVDYNKSTDMEPWLNYTGRWGPKFTYKFIEEVIKAVNKLPQKVKDLALKLLYKLPDELRSEEGPPGPKMKDSWIGDELV